MLLPVATPSAKAPTVTLEGIERARARLQGQIRSTPLVESERLGAVCGARLWLKQEHHQTTGSFKERGACNRLLCLNDDERQRGVVAASAGNHALGLAYHGQRLGVPVRVVMPRFAPLVKVDRCRSYGAEVVLVGETFDEARSIATAMATNESLTLVHGFDNPWVIEGQGTLGLELLEQLPDVEAVVVPVGGGGLIAGVTAAIKAIKPEVEIIGVEAKHAPTLSRALAAGRPLRVDVEPGLADGLAVAEVGQLCFSLLQGHVDRVALVGEGEIATAIVQLMEVEKTIVEGAGAVGLAWALGQPSALRDRRVAVILSGGNIDLNVVARVIERGLASAGRLCKVTVELRDHPGALAQLLTRLAETEANLLEVEHDRNFAPADVAQVNVSLLLETRDRDHIARMRQVLDDIGLSYQIFGATPPRARTLGR